MNSIGVPSPKNDVEYKNVRLPQALGLTITMQFFLLMIVVSLGLRYHDDRIVVEDAWFRLGDVESLIDVWKTAGSKTLNPLIRDEDHTKALNAKWISIVAPRWSQDVYSLLDEGRLREFIGFVEGRLRINAPTWWTRSLITNWSEKTKLEHSFDGRRMDAPFINPLNPKGGVTIIQNGKEFHARSDFGDVKLQVKLDLPKRFVEGAPKRTTATGIQPTPSEVNPLFSFNPNDVVVSPLNGRDGVYAIACFQRKTGKLKWSSHVVSNYSIGSVIGVPPVHTAQMIVNRDRVLVFGAIANFIYLQAFDLDNGNVIAWWDGATAGLSFDW